MSCIIILIVYVNVVVVDLFMGRRLQNHLWSTSSSTESGSSRTRQRHSGNQAEFNDGARETQKLAFATA